MVRITMIGGIYELLDELYGAQDSVGLMMDRLSEAGVEFSPDAANDEIREIYVQWVYKEASTALDEALELFKKTM